MSISPAQNPKKMTCAEQESQLPVPNKGRLTAAIGSFFFLQLAQMFRLITG
jgi:phosphoribosylaminoimidazole-succinocarboxamide synthase